VRGSRRPPLERAREALEQGDLRAAAHHGWAAAIAAARVRNVDALEAVNELAKELRDQAGGRVESDAQAIAAYCSAAIAQARSGLHDRSPIGKLLMRDRQASVKICPDCAEAVQAAARVCRYCGYRFEAAPEGRESGPPGA
jgi:hypothetical protein